MTRTRPVGIHVSIASKLALAVDRAADLGCAGTFQIFTSSPRRWAAKPLDQKEAEIFNEKASRLKFVPVVHMPYMPNLSSPDAKFYSDSVEVLVREIHRSSTLAVPYLVVHFGSHMGSSIEEGHKKIISACKTAIKRTASTKVRILLETSAGVRNSIGSKFEYIRAVLDQVDDTSRMGVCLDTCHVFASGYDLRTRDACERVIAEFDKVVGLERLYVIHVNDSKGELGQGIDRHEHIGLGHIGDTGFKCLFALDALRNIPLVLETPIDDRRGDRENVGHVKKLLEEL